MPRPADLFDRASHVPVLIFQRGPATAFIVRPRSHRLTVGRGVDCDVQLPDPSLLLSRRHLAIERRAGGVVVRDLSTHGTLLDDQPLGDQPGQLRAGAVVRLGDWSLVLDDTPGEGSAEESTRPMQEHTAPTLSPSLPGVIGRSPVMLALSDQVARLARFDVPVLVTGETGTGKELVAQALHSLSVRRGGSLVALNCGAIHAGTAASELFGHARGAFTGADGPKVGVFERAGGGTVFLDELGELHPAQQAALLRVLETREVLPMGASRTVAVDFRLVAATHRELQSEVAGGRFREDLYYRIAVAGVRVPPLRERRGDLRLLAVHFLAEASVGPAPPLLDDALDWLDGHRWPGNVRELRNVIQRALIASDGRAIGASLLELGARSFAPGAGQLAADGPAPDGRGELMRARLTDALRRSGGNKTRAAALLGISRSTLYEQLRRTGLVVPRRVI
jgi:DNA-binding NtrC family response regulator